MDVTTEVTKITETKLKYNPALSEKIIGLCIEVHKSLGPGLLESVYEECLCYELVKSGIAFERQKPIPIRYKDIVLDCGFRFDILLRMKLFLNLKQWRIFFQSKRHKF